MTTNMQIDLLLTEPDNSETANGVAVPVERIVMYLYRVYDGRLKPQHAIEAGRIREWWEEAFTLPMKSIIIHHPSDGEISRMSGPAIITFECPYTGDLLMPDDNT